MKTNLIFILIILLSTPDSTFSQVAPSKYWVRFKDRAGTPYSVSNPSAYLSQRAIDRRTKQSIPVIQNDLPVNPSYVSGVQATGVTVLYRSKWFNSVIIYTTDTNQVNTVKALPYVQSVSKVARKKRKPETGGFQDKFMKETVSTVKNIPGNSTHSPNAYDYGQALNQVSMIGCDCMHNKGYDGKGMVIAVIDAGFYSADTLNGFDSLWANNQILGTWDFVQGNASVFEDHPHGMMVLSLIGSNWPGQIVGTAPQAKFWLLRSEEAATEYVIEEHNWVAAAEFADSVGADVLNTSLGYTTFDDSTMNHTRQNMDGNTNIISIATDIAASKGIIPVCAAGNDGGSAWFYISAPADADSALTVGAVDATKAYVGFSSKGPSADGQVKPTVAAQGSGTSVINWDGTVAQGGGTSFASPLTAGGVAVLWQAHPNRTSMEIYNAIIQSADQYSSPDSLKGYGVPNFCTADQILTSIVEKRAGKPTLKVIPNPFNKEIEIVFYADENGETEISLYDVTGKLVLQKNRINLVNRLNRITLETTSSLAKGMYVLKVKTNESIQSVKLVKE